MLILCSYRHQLLVEIARKQGFSKVRIRPFLPDVSLPCIFRQAGKPEDLDMTPS